LSKKRRVKDSNILGRIKNIRLPSYSAVKPSTSLITVLFIAISIFILGGGLYVILEGPMAFLPSATRPIFYYPGIAEQTASESLYFIFFLTMGVSGGFLALWSTRFTYRPREAKILLLVGVIMLGLALFGSEWILFLKRS
jgi:hypothetical protein